MKRAVSEEHVSMHTVCYNERKKEVLLARRGGYRSDKRRKELDRLKKQEEKRQRRFNREKETEEDETQQPGEETEEDQGNESMPQEDE